MPEQESDYLSPSKPRVFAHRGLALDAPENTLLAFGNALQAGATHLETDVHVSRDGVVVISHDPRPHGAPAGTAPIAELTFAELSAIDLGNGQRMPALEEALAAFPRARFNIDVKAGAAAEPVARVIRDCGATRRVLVTSFSDATRRRTTASLPGVASSPGASRLRLLVGPARSGAVGLVRRGLRGFAAVQVPERVGAVHLVTPRFIRTVQAAGVEVHVWTVNEPAAMERLLDLGVDGLVTDRCDLAAQLVASR